MSKELMANIGDWLELNGKRYQASQLTPADFAEARSYLRGRMPSKVDEIKTKLDGLHVEVQKAMMLEAMAQDKERGSLQSDEAQLWMAGPEGIAFFLWRLVVKRSPTITLDFMKAEVQAVIDKMPTEKHRLQQHINSNSGVKQNPTVPGSNRKDRRASRSRK